jgi:hypothetical protein
MTPQPAPFPYLDMNPGQPGTDLMPLLPLTLTLQGRSVPVLGLVDTGATINVLPYDIGMQLGADWDQLKKSVQLAGMLAQVEARALVLAAEVGQFPTVLLAFAWAKSDKVPLLLGQVNFLLEFEVCFFRARGHFEVKPK